MVAYTNEERFIDSCNLVGEADVRQKLSAGRYSDRRAEWAAKWLEQLDNGKSDAIKAEERNSRLHSPSKGKRYLPGILGIAFLIAIGGAFAVSQL